MSSILKIRKENTLRFPAGSVTGLYKTRSVNSRICVSVIKTNKDCSVIPNIQFSYRLTSLLWRHRDNRPDSTVSVSSGGAKNVRNVESRHCKVLRVPCWDISVPIKCKCLSLFSLKTPRFIISLHGFHRDNRALFLLVYPSCNILLTLWILSLPATLKHLTPMNLCFHSLLLSS